MNIRKSIIGSFLLAFCLILGADASKLPDDVWKYIKLSLPEANQRFDSVITLKNGNMYIPLYPPASVDVDKIEIEYTYPTGATLKQKPEVVLFNNGYSLLKVFKDETGNYSLTKQDNLPIKVRLGLMPQDMLTPIGLKMPESLKLTLGNLLIPTKEETSLTKLDENSEKNPYSAVAKRNEFIVSDEFKNKKTFVNPKNSKFLEVYDKSSPNPLYELKLTSMPKKIITNSQNMALAMYWNSKELDIINLQDEDVVAKVQLENIPSDAVLDRKNNIVFVSSSKGQAINVVDLNSAQLVKVIKLDQKPSKIAYSEVDGSIAFYDEYLSKVFNVTKNEAEEYIVQAVGEAKNVSKILSDVMNIYAISRTDSDIKVFDKVQGKLITSSEIDRKPTDAIRIGNRIYILCSKEGYIDVYDTVLGQIISKTELPKDEFYSKITTVQKEKIVLITGENAKSYLIYDTDKLELVKKQDSYIDVANVIIMDKGQNQ